MNGIDGAGGISLLDERDCRRWEVGDELLSAAPRDVTVGSRFEGLAEEGLPL